MATNYPGALDSLTNPAGTSLVTNPSHATQHINANDAIEAIQVTAGTTAGTNVLKDFSAGQFPARVNSGGTIVQTLVGGTINNTIAGTPRLTGGTASAFLLGTSLMQGGTVANAALGTPTLMGGTIAVSSGVTIKPGAALAASVTTLTDAAGGTIAVDAQNAQVYHLIIGASGGNRTFGTPSNATEGQAIVFRIKQNAGNTGTLVFPSIYRMGNGGTPTLGTQSTYNYVAFRFNTIDTKWDHQGNSLGLI